MMKYLSRISFFYVLFSLVLLTASCKKIFKESSEKVVKKSLTTVTKEVVDDVGTKTLRKMDVVALKKMNWKDLDKLIKKENTYLVSSLDKFKGSTRKSIVKEMQNDPAFFRALTSYGSVIDDCNKVIKNAPSLKNNINFLKMISKGNSKARTNGTVWPFKDFNLEDSNGIVKYYQGKDKTLVAEYRDGVVFLKENLSSSNRLVRENSLLRKELLPNSMYKLKGKNGFEFTCTVDNLGRPNKIIATNLNPNELSTGIVNRVDDVNLGNKWIESFKKIKQVSQGNDLNVEYSLKYIGDEKTPKYLGIKVKTNKGKSVLDSNFENLDLKVNRAVYTASDNANLLKKLKGKIVLTEDKRIKLLQEMGEDIDLAKLIHDNPSFNVKRWVNSRNSVDMSKILKTPSGKYPINSKVYAGNVYYFNPHLNSGLKARLKKGNDFVDLRGARLLSYDDLIELDKAYPNGVKFTEKGFPDFSSIAFKGKDGKQMIIDIGKLTGNSNKDISLAEINFQKLGYIPESGFTWHHVENSTKLQRVPTVIHQLVDHSGGISMSK